MNSSPGGRPNSLPSDQLRLLGKVARMYHERGMRQPQIAEVLNISQPRVSRLLRQAAETGIVRTVVTMPAGTYTDLEERVQIRYGLRDVVVVDADGSGDNVMPALGAATADYLDVTLIGQDILGVSTWSETLIEAAKVMRPKSVSVVSLVVQLLGGLGNSAVQVNATRLTERLASLTGATPVFLPAPGLVSSPSTRRAMMNDPTIGSVVALWKRLTVALVGIGSLEPSRLISQSGNVFGSQEREELQSAGAVGDVCFRFFDADGNAVRSEIDHRLIGISEAELMRVPRRIGVAGGERKYPAVRAAVRGGWVNVLITDLITAERLAG
jgi:DNA-binding transcriptional regulator LsrR (DeoR family)